MMISVALPTLFANLQFFSLSKVFCKALVKKR